MKKIVPLVALGLVSLTQSAIAGDIGFGVSAKSNDGYIYLPIKVGSSYIVEPYIGYYKSKESRSLTRGYGSSNEFSYENHFYGVGLFRSQPINDKFGVYYGLRSAYAKRSREDLYTETGYPDGHNEENYSGYVISPTLGINYKITSQFLVSLEAEYSYLKYDGEASRTSIGPEYFTNHYDLTRKEQNTSGRLLVRYFF